MLAVLNIYLSSQLLGFVFQTLLLYEASISEIQTSQELITYKQTYRQTSIMKGTRSTREDLRPRGAVGSMARPQATREVILTPLLSLEICHLYHGSLIVDLNSGPARKMQYSQVWALVILTTTSNLPTSPQVFAKA